MDVKSIILRLENDVQYTREVFWHTELNVGGLSAFEACKGEFVEVVNRREKKMDVYSHYHRTNLSLY